MIGDGLGNVGVYRMFIVVWKSLDPTNQYEATQSYTKLQSYILRLRSLRELICSLDKYGKVMQS